MTENILRTDEREDVAGSLRHTLASYKLLEDDPQAWKWVFLALYTALSGACVCHLTTTSGLGALSDNSAKELSDYFERSRAEPGILYPATRLALQLRS